MSYKQFSNPSTDPYQAIKVALDISFKMFICLHKEKALSHMSESNWIRLNGLIMDKLQSNTKLHFTPHLQQWAIQQFTHKFYESSNFAYS